MKPYLCYGGIIVTIALYWLSNYASRHRIGRIGRYLNSSDHYYWSMAVEDKRRELDELMKVEPRSKGGEDG